MILSSARLKDEMKENLKNEFPESEFRFYNKMKEAAADLEHAEILITFGEDLNEELVERAKALKWIMVISAGLDKMPFEALEKKNILITNARGIHKTPMAEYTISMMLQVSRKAKELMEKQKEQIWDRKVPMTEISGQTIGVLGTGAIGGEIARLAKAFHMKTIGFNRSGKTVDHFDLIVDRDHVEKLYKESDFIVNVLPATDETKDFINADSFSLMKPTSVLINIGRGTTIAEGDLISALNDQKIGYAVLDVFEKEPLSADSPLWNMENVMITPHLSGISPQYQTRALEIFSENYKLYMKNKLKDMVNIIPYDRGY
ncbi:D-2-hydroxyacid dehydrogenase [Bacillus sp. NEB1478]|uniref:D-2-hydroxyacid dehydrogenase n=1 Tax=Bacillus sp. NEB1478 TaxID=3073816 RepID=UPI002873E4E3|nr:D-2-hydroxyacid dehydrogenase [Bacillus sp. NEB1478]WNB91578.1 D-2-hydroxyacid dehydrogenase [Bacillus sp. NEB1478]